MHKNGHQRIGSADLGAVFEIKPNKPFELTQKRDKNPICLTFEIFMQLFQFVASKHKEFLSKGRGD